jgi:cytochrome c-type biogenesis protein CcmE
MKRTRKRLVFVLAGLATLGLAATLVLIAFQDSIVFFYSPSEIMAKEIGPDRALRLGGLVEEGTLDSSGGTVQFRITDLENSVAVAYTGILPDLFREGQGVVAEGRLGADGVFHATRVLAKHDETYMPPEVAKALKDQGHWQGEGEAP